jgi:demethylmenaquinone methyltransferase/2-methoxy-6-polyprenyl-1,4-benzoquinol methylase
MNEISDYKEKTILDLCCGTGNQLKLLSKNKFKNLHCLDLSKSMLAIAKKGNHAINIYNEDATKTSFKNNTFDLVIISFAIHEKDRDTQTKMLNEANRLIKEDGLMLIVDYDFNKSKFNLGKLVITVIEKIAGKEHYHNFKNYIKNNGLLTLIDKNNFQLMKQNKKIFKTVTISLYKKLNK